MPDFDGAGADVLICGGIGGGAQSALATAGIKLYGGVSGAADEAVEAYLAGKLDYNPDVRCSHHEHEHSCAEHKCGEDKHGCAGNEMIIIKTRDGRNYDKQRRYAGADTQNDAQPHFLYACGRRLYGAGRRDR